MTEPAPSLSVPIVPGSPSTPPEPQAPWLTKRVNAAASLALAAFGLISLLASALVLVADRGGGAAATVAPSPSPVVVYRYIPMTDQAPQAPASRVITLSMTGAARAYLGAVYTPADAFLASLPGTDAYLDPRVAVVSVTAAEDGGGCEIFVDGVTVATGHAESGQVALCVWRIGPGA